MVPIILIIAGILLVVLNFNAVRKEKKSFQDKLNVKQSEMGNCELEIGKIRKEFAETILELQKQIEDLKTQGKQDSYEDILSEEVEEKLVEEEIEDIKDDEDNTEEEPKKSENSDKVTEEYTNNVKIDEIRGLLKDNISVSDICEKTGIGKGEVLLIKELYVK